MIRGTRDYFIARREGRNLGYNTPTPPSLPESSFTGDTTDLFRTTTRLPKKLVQLQEIIEATKKDDPGLFTFEPFELVVSKSKRWYSPKRGKYEVDNPQIAPRIRQVAQGISRTLTAHERSPQDGRARHTRITCSESQPFFERTKRKVAVITLGVVALGFTGGFFGKNTQETSQAARQSVTTEFSETTPTQHSHSPTVIPLAEPAAAIYMDNSPQPATQDIRIITISEETPNLWKAVKSELGPDASDTKIANTINSLGLENPNLVHYGDQFLFNTDIR